MTEKNEGKNVTLSDAIAELAKGLKAVNFYPPNHPSLKKILNNVVKSLESIPIPPEGLEIEVSKEQLSAHGEKISEKHLAISDLRKNLYTRRTQKLIILPGLTTKELEEFLKAISIDPKDLLKEGGLEEVLISKKIAHIWVNKVDYERITEKLKEDKADEAGEGELLLFDDPIDIGTTMGTESEADIFIPEVSPEEENIDLLIETIAGTSSPTAYRDLVLRISHRIKSLPESERLTYTEKVYKIYARHIEYPPGGDEEIRKLARTGIKELGTEEVIKAYVPKFRSRSIQEKSEAETILRVLGDKSVPFLLEALAKEEDLITRRSIVDLIISIGERAIPDIVSYLQDPRWYVVRNMITILGAMENPDVAPYVVDCLKHSDQRVQKEALKALSKIPGPLSLSTLGEYCFHDDEDLACLAITALSAKKEDKAVEILHERFLTKKLFFPDFRPAREIIEALRTIGSESALEVLKRIATYNPFIKPRKVKELKKLAVQAIGRMKSEKALQIIEEFSESSDPIIREEATIILKKKKLKAG